LTQFHPSPTMPVDVDAYMARQIPSLSRGGSWLPDNQLGHQASGLPARDHHAFSQAGFPSPSLSSASTHTLRFLTAPIPAASTLSWMQTGPSHAATPASVHLESFARPVFHNGLPRPVQTFMSDEPSPRGLPKAAQSQPVSPARLVQSMHPHVAASSADMGGARYRDDPPSLYEGRSWERDSGGPKRASRGKRTIRLHAAVERTAYLRSCRDVRLRPSTRSHRGTVAHRALLAPRLVDCRAMRESGRLQEVRGSWQPVVPACADRPCYEPPRIMNSATLWKAK